MNIKEDTQEEQTTQKELIKQKLKEKDPATLKEIIATHKKIEKLYDNLYEKLQELQENYQKHTEFFDNLEQLEEEIKKPQYNGITLDELCTSGYDDNCKIIKDSALDKALKAIKNSNKINIQLFAAADDELPFIKKGIADKITISTDLINNQIPKLKLEQGQKEISLTHTTQNQILLAKTTLSFEKLATFTERPITNQHKLVMIACANAEPIKLKDGTNRHYTTVNNIYKALTGKKATKQTQRDKVLKILDDLGAIRVKNFTNKFENELYNKRNIFTANDEPLVLWRGGQAVLVNGAKINDAIEIIEEPIFMRYAKATNQITTFGEPILQLPYSFTEDNCSIHCYALRQVQMRKSNKQYNKKIIYKKLYEELGITEKNRKKRKTTREKLEQSINHFKECNFIKDYELKKDGIEIKI